MVTVVMLRPAKVLTSTLKVSSASTISSSVIAMSIHTESPSVELAGIFSVSYTEAVSAPVVIAVPST